MSWSKEKREFYEESMRRGRANGGKRVFPEDTRNKAEVLADLYKNGFQ